MVRVALRVTPRKVLSTGSTLPQVDTNTHFCHHHTKRAPLSLLVVCDRFSEAFGLRSVTSAVLIKWLLVRGHYHTSGLIETNLQRKGMEKWRHEAEFPFVGGATYYLGRLFIKKDLMCIADLANLICVLVQGSVLTLRFFKTLWVLTWGLLEFVVVHLWRSIKLSLGFMM